MSRRTTDRRRVERRKPKRGVNMRVEDTAPSKRHRRAAHRKLGDK
jgi:hypothetical protein